jgi:ribosomal protein L19E
MLPPIMKAIIHATKGQSPTGTPQSRLGDRVSWVQRIGSFLRDLNDGIHGEIRIEQRTYRVKIADLKSGQSR